eukprot:Skav225436  [mRNA]  locus=scaffold1668:25258:32540:- [translate_table: standard]
MRCLQLCLLSCLLSGVASDPWSADDECAGDDSCSLDALQRRAKVQPAEDCGGLDDLSLLCSRAASVCRNSDDDGHEHLTVGKLTALLAAFFGATGLHLGEEDLVPCKVLCEASAALLKKHGVKLPPAPDVGCFRSATGAQGSSSGPWPPVGWWLVSRAWYPKQVEPSELQRKKAEDKTSVKTEEGTTKKEQETSSRRLIPVKVEKPKAEKLEPEVKEPQRSKADKQGVEAKEPQKPKEPPKTKESVKAEGGKEPSSASRPKEREKSREALPAQKEAEDKRSKEAEDKRSILDERDSDPSLAERIYSCPLYSVCMVNIVMLS